MELADFVDFTDFVELPNKFELTEKERDELLEKRFLPHGQPPFIN